MADLPSIEPAATSDLEGVLALLRVLNADNPPLGEAPAAEIWAQLLASDQTTVLVARAAGAVVATCTLTVVPNLSRGGRPYALIENVVTHPDVRRRGLGRAVLQAALDRAWAAGCYKVMLATGSKRPETLRFYEGAGFEAGTKTFFEAKRL
jgi:GNAT superfamily N-acetyltransferase